MNLLSFFDYGITVATVSLLGIGFAVLVSTSPTLVGNFILFIIVGIIGFITFATIDYRQWSRFRWVFYVGSLLLLVSLFFAPSIRGSTRWIDVGIFRIQPSELIKPLVVIILASIISKEKKTTLFSFFKHAVLLLPFLGLIFMQPDLGNVIVYIGTFLIMEIMNGLSLKFVFLGTIGLGAFAPLFWRILKEYQRVRILSFLNPEIDPAGTGYNALQAIIAIGSGQLWGLGLGRGTQSHLLFLPEYHTDFVFASLVEELGFIGGLLVLTFYALFLSRFLVASKNADDSFGRLLALGLFAQLFIQVIINIGMNLGLLPITGITLPLISYGGSSILSTFINIGILTSILALNRRRSPIVIGSRF
ncbi:rod shape-determining protein RodA [Candidatus Gottesmanbacteria bacterium]|nr:rod shape-determining protein RodA [Candidatus Gottesmanbacteria bacterium]